MLARRWSGVGGCFSFLDVVGVGDAVLGGVRRLGRSGTDVTLDHSVGVEDLE